ncbi:GNAT family N-acetyltransferase [Phenylobacterium sp. J367]|uniref:GNAT family N-acetyltransferase n=1 Tax=Phenylobacterium sp. J367 TaxID=2898435 RepID=UPI0021512669|nr:GNAT family protein [Phenylobacterium sp. J367]MCR5878133.1 GNAT family N-acetyltransferase [Phenylobacterium sp. J367]
MSVAQGSIVTLSRLTARDLKAASKVPFALSAVEPLSNPVRAREVYDETGFWTDDAGVLAIEVDDRLVGTIQFYRSGPGIQGFEISLVLHDRDDYGKGYGVEALKLMSDLLFNAKPNLRRLQLLVPTWDDRAARRVEDAGYASEGILRKAGFGADGPEDCILYSMVRDRG